MTQQSAIASPVNGSSSAHDLFALTDEQILEIEPEAQDVEVRDGESATTAAGDGTAKNTETSEAAASQATRSVATTIAEGAAATKKTQGEGAAEPPAWLTAQMKDPWNGEAARELWDGVQQARQDAAAYREVFAKPEEARAAAERARALDDIDRAYFGAQGSGPEQARAARAQLAAAMLREDPAAFREMVFEGLRALEQANTAAQSASIPATGATQNQTQSAATSQPVAQNSSGTHSAEQDARLSAYASFERAANEDLEKSVGGTIERTLHQALPNAGRAENVALTARLAVTIRQDVEKALQGDRQLGEQVAQVLAGKRLDNETRAQVVRLINERAQQLVPVAAKRVLSDWTQTTLAAHRSKSARTDAASTRREVASTASAPSDLHGRTREGSRPARNDGRATSSSRVDYGKLSDEQILDL